MKRFFIALLLFTANALNALPINPYVDNINARMDSLREMIVDQARYNIEDEHNGDDTNVANYAGSFTKTLDHDGTTGVATTTDGQPNYVRLLTALQTGAQADFNAIERAPNATRKFVNPQAAFAKSMIGTPCTNIPIPSAPTLTSAQAAADMIEVYLQAVCRDVRFSDYGTDSLTTNSAAPALSALAASGAYRGPSTSGTVDPATQLFRGISAGDLEGIYVSQFLYLPTYYHFESIEQKQYVPVAQAREFGVAWNDFVAIQDGAIPQAYDATDFNGERLIITGKDIATVVHSDAPGAFFFNAVNILLYNGFPLAPNLPYNNGTMPNEDAFVTMMITDINSAIFYTAQEALKNAWAHKWRASRKLRPEAMAGLVHRVVVTGANTYDLDSSLLSPVGGVDVLQLVNLRNIAQESIPDNPLPSGQGDTYLLPLVYPEGSPCHPAYPAGHATIAGACATIVKAFFDDEELIVDHVTPIKPDPSDMTGTTTVALDVADGLNVITVGSELDKLASNIALARDFAGVHYRSDGDEGIALGEKVALKILQDWAHIYSEQGFTGFELTKRDGQRIRVTTTGVVNI